MEIKIDEFLREAGIDGSIKNLSIEGLNAAIALYQIPSDQINSVLFEIFNQTANFLPQIYGDRIFLYPREMSAAYHLFNSIEKNKILAEFCNSVSQSPVVLDIGANVGQFSFFLSKESKIYCLEPVAELIPFVEYNIPLAEKIISSCIVPEQSNDEHIKFLVNKNSFQTSSRFVENIIDRVTGIEERFVTAIKPSDLAGLVERYSEADVELIIKIDIQGGEYEILMDLSAQLNNVVALAVEATWLDPRSISKISHLMKMYNFEHIYVINDVSLGADLILTRCQVQSDSFLKHILLSELE